MDKMDRELASDDPVYQAIPQDRRRDPRVGFSDPRPLPPGHYGNDEALLLYELSALILAAVLGGLTAYIMLIA